MQAIIPLIGVMQLHGVNMLPGSLGQWEVPAGSDYLPALWPWKCPLGAGGRVLQAMLVAEPSAVAMAGCVHFQGGMGNGLFSFAGPSLAQVTWATCVPGHRTLNGGRLCLIFSSPRWLHWFALTPLACARGTLLPESPCMCRERSSLLIPPLLLLHCPTFLPYLGLFL